MKAPYYLQKIETVSPCRTIFASFSEDHSFTLTGNNVVIVLVSFKEKVKNIPSIFLFAVCSKRVFKNDKYYNAI